MMRVACSKKLHVIETDEVVIRTTGYWSLRAAEAAGTDEDAQRWLGWPSDMVRGYESSRDELLNLELDDEPDPVGSGWFALINRRNHRIMGTVKITSSRSTRPEIGGYLAPQYRGQGLGAQLFTLGRILAHAHLGLPEIYAGTEVGNVACRQSLLKAGFTPTDGTAHHTLPDGREVRGGWFRSAMTCDVICGYRRSRPRWWRLGIGKRS
ncbi:GNAT family N-acetyltransferase [Nonomuraea sp. NPDC050536]|uniref:GNAT family N-acetyltransferase n=1 Tax=Nonomuraea sp. NPDC050536 TaxID=3364366 RepID=UPI0037C84522